MAKINNLAIPGGVQTPCPPPPPPLDPPMIYISCFAETSNINTSNNNINKINKLQRRACKLILAQEYDGLENSLKRLNILSFDQSVFLNKAKIMYKVFNNLAPIYLQELSHMRDVTLNNTASNLRSVAQNNYCKSGNFRENLIFANIREVVASRK